MKPNREVLSSLLKTIQTCQLELRSMLDTSLGSNLRTTLKKQLREYDSMETEVYTLALQRGLELPEMDPVSRILRDRMTRLKVSGRNTDSRIADILIRRNTKGMILGLKKLHQTETQDHQIRILSQKLLDCERDHIRQMQTFL